MTKKRGIFYGIVSMALLIGGITGCTKTGSSFTNAAVTYVSVLHMAPYAPATDVFLNGTLSSPTGGIPANSGSNQYAHLQPANYDIQFKKTGVDSLMAEIPSSLYDTVHFYTLILYNTAPGGGQVRAAKIVDDFTGISASNANYRFFNLSPDAPPVDLYLNGTLAQAGRAPVDNLFNTGYNSFQQAPANASSSLVVKKAGTDSVLATLSGVDIENGSVYTFFLSGQKNYTTNSFKISALPASY